MADMKAGGGRQFWSREEVMLVPAPDNLCRRDQPKYGAGREELKRYVLDA